jgi:hypothetical protein
VAEWAQCLVGRHHQGGSADAGDEVGQGEGLAGAVTPNKV